MKTIEFSGLTAVGPMKIDKLLCPTDSRRTHEVLKNFSVAAVFKQRRTKSVLAVTHPTTDSAQRCLTPLIYACVFTLPHEANNIDITLEVIFTVFGDKCYIPADAFLFG